MHFSSQHPATISPLQFPSELQTEHGFIYTLALPVSLSSLYSTPKLGTASRGNLVPDEEARQAQRSMCEVIFQWKLDVVL